MLALPSPGVASPITGASGTVIACGVTLTGTDGGPVPATLRAVTEQL